MCIQQDGALVQARAYPKLVLIRPTSHGETLHLDAPGMPTLVLPRKPEVNSQSRLISCRSVQLYLVHLCWLILLIYFRIEIVYNNVKYQCNDMH